MAASVFAVTGEDHDFPAKKAEIGTPRKLLGGERTVKRVDQVHKARADTQYGNAESKASFRFLHCDGSSAASQTAFVTASCRRWLSAAVGERRGEVSPQSERCFAVRPLRPLRPRVSERPRLVGTASATWPASQIYLLRSEAGSASKMRASAGEARTCQVAIALRTIALRSFDEPVLQHLAHRKV